MRRIVKARKQPGHDFKRHQSHPPPFLRSSLRFCIWKDVSGVENKWSGLRRKRRVGESEG
jgi:hypothetical protein